VNRRPSPALRRILGIDPGLRITGFGVLDLRGNALAYVTSGCIRATGTSLPIRLGVIVRDLAQVIAEQNPTEVAIERVFVNVNPNTTLLLGQARGAAIAAAVIAGLPVSEYTAGQVKQAVAGVGRAPKAQVQEMVRRLLLLPGRPAVDAADALAAAICHAHASTGVGALTQRSARAGRVRPAA
jgi:crossover junction endodeoxyribonuclease RuvC